jgi:hypothetical protein
MTDRDLEAVTPNRIVEAILIQMKVLYKIYLLK